MKKFLPLLLIAAAVAGCKKSETPPPAAPAPVAVAPAAPANQDPNAVNPAELEGGAPAPAAAQQGK